MSITYVGQHEFAFATDSEILGTIGISTCLRIIAYNQKTKKTLLMHIDPLTNIVEVVQLLNLVGGQVHIVGTSTHDYEVLISYIKEKYDVSLKIVHDFSVSVKVDSRTGEVVVGNINLKDLIKHPKYESNMIYLENITSTCPLFGIGGHDDNYVYMSDYTDEENILIDKHKKSKHMPAYMKEPIYCEECKDIVSMHIFICSKAIKCSECGQRTDIGYMTRHNNTCSQSKEFSLHGERS